MKYWKQYQKLIEWQEVKIYVGCTKKSLLADKKLS